MFDSPLMNFILGLIFTLAGLTLAVLFAFWLYSDEKPATDASELALSDSL